MTLHQVALLAIGTLVLQAALPTTSSNIDVSAGEIVKPIWREQPSQAARNQAYPYNAMLHEKTGMAVVQCIARADGTFSGCRVICETPIGYGFGRAAMSIAAAFKLEPTLPDGRSVEGMTVTHAFPFGPGDVPIPKRCDI